MPIGNEPIQETALAPDDFWASLEAGQSFSENLPAASPKPAHPGRGSVRGLDPDAFWKDVEGMYGSPGGFGGIQSRFEKGARQLVAGGADIPASALGFSAMLGGPGEDLYKRIRAGQTAANPPSLQTGDIWTEGVPRFMGSLPGVIATGGAGRLIAGTKGAMVGMGALGAAQTAPQMYYDVLEKTGDRGKAAMAGLTGTGIGTLEAFGGQVLGKLPILGKVLPKLLGDIEKKTSGSIIKGLMVAGGVIQESGQEGISSLLQTGTYSALTDEDIDHWKQAAQAAEVGGVIEGIFQALTGIPLDQAAKPQGQAQAPGAPTLAQGTTSPAMPPQPSAPTAAPRAAPEAAQAGPQEVRAVGPVATIEPPKPLTIAEEAAKPYPGLTAEESQEVNQFFADEEKRDEERRGRIRAAGEKGYASYGDVLESVMLGEEVPAGVLKRYPGILQKAVELSREGSSEAGDISDLDLSAKGAQVAADTEQAVEAITSEEAKVPEEIEQEKAPTQGEPRTPDWQRLPPGPARRAARLSAQVAKAPEDIGDLAEAEVRQGAATMPEDEAPEVRQMLASGIPLDIPYPTFKAVKSFAQRNLTSRGHLPEQVHALAQKAASSTQAEMRAMKLTLKDFHGAMRKVYGAKAVSPEVLEHIGSTFKGENAIESLPEPLQAPVRSMREHVDTLSRRLIDSGAVEGELAAKISKNIGFYATRAYRVFNDPKWASKVPQDVRNKAKAMIRSEYAENGTNLDDAEVDTIIDTMLYEGKAAETMIGLLSRSKRLGSKDLSILRRRSRIAPEIRALYGEYTDPMSSYALSVAKTARLVSNHEFLTATKEAGLGEFFFEEGDLRGRSKAGATVKIAAEESDPMRPLNGLYTTPEIKTAFDDFYKKDVHGPFFRAYFAVHGGVKYAKTIISHVTHFRNFFSNAGFAVAQGHWRVNELGKSFKTIVGDIASLKDEAFRARVLDAYKYGILGQSVHAGELHGIFKDASVYEDPNEYLQRSAGQKIRQVRQGIEGLYQAEDGFWKVYAWENEQARYAKAHPDWSEEKLKEHTAKIVRDTYPTYDLVPKAVKAARKLPIGNFVSFPAEIVRTAANTVQLIRKELDDPATRAIGAQRLVGAAAAATGTAGIAAVSRMLTGMSRDDDEDARHFVPPWSKNSEIAWVGEKDGKRTWIDLSYADPYAYLKKPLKALLSGGDVDEALMESFWEAARPFLEPNIALKAAAEAYLNKTESGREVYSEAASTSDKAAAIMKHIGESMTPGAYNAIDKLRKGLTGYVEPYGREYDPTIEAIAQFGVRVSALDIPTSLSFLASTYERDLASATSMFTRVAGSKGDVTAEDLAASKGKMEASRQEKFEEMHAAVRAALNLGVPLREVQKILRKSLSEENTRNLISGRYQKYTPSKATLKQYPRMSRMRN